MNISAYPRCASRLKHQRANLSETTMNEYWAAVCVAVDISDKALKRFGGFNFNDRSPENGRRLLARLEQFIASRQKRHKGKWT